jgi:predicted enzyme related to lactoylglutathione lyase
MLRVDTGEGWAEFNAGGITFALRAGKDLAPKETGFCFAVDSCDDAAATLKARGVTGVTDRKGVCDDGRCFSFKDPFGNTFSAFGK